MKWGERYQACKKNSRGESIEVDRGEFIEVRILSRTGKANSKKWSNLG